MRGVKGRGENLGVGGDNMELVGENAEDCDGDNTGVERGAEEEFECENSEGVDVGLNSGGENVGGGELGEGFGVQGMVERETAPESVSLDCSASISVEMRSDQPVIPAGIKLSGITLHFYMKPRSCWFFICKSTQSFNTIRIIIMLPEKSINLSKLIA